MAGAPLSPRGLGCASQRIKEYGSRTAAGVPVVCLPELTRTVSDFAALAPALANDMALSRESSPSNSRGRGQSDYDSNPDNYNLAVELADVATVSDRARRAACRLHPAVRGAGS